MRPRSTALALAIFVLVACEDREKLCRAIGETRVSALQPRDRLYWEENCLTKGLTPAQTAAREEERKQEEKLAAAKAERHLRLDKLSAPMVAFAKALPDEAPPVADSAEAAGTGKPMVARDGNTTTMVWNKESGFDRCRLLVRVTGKRVTRATVDCSDALAGDADKGENFLTR